MELIPKLFRLKDSKLRFKLNSSTTRKKFKVGYLTWVLYGDILQVYVLVEAPGLCLAGGLWHEVRQLGPAKAAGIGQAKVCIGRLLSRSYHHQGNIFVHTAISINLIALKVTQV